MRVDFLGLEAFLSIAEHGSFFRAAAQLNLSHTALSHRMRKLESDLGVKLLTRTTRHVALTPAGVELLPKARQTMADIAASFDSLRAQGRARQERLTVGCLPTLAMHWLPPILDELRAAYPKLSVRVLDNSALEIADRVQSGEAEFGITVLAADRWDLEITPLLKEPFVLACPARHALARRPSVGWSALEGLPLVRVSLGTGNRTLIDAALGARRETLTWAYEVQHVASALSLVAAGLGLAVVPRLAADGARSSGVAAVALRNPGIARTLGIVARRNLPLSPAADALLALVRKRARGR
jgi:DNA-binding transcriptional LysR family regulator